MSVLTGLYVSIVLVLSSHVVLNAGWTSTKQFQGWSLSKDGSKAFARDKTTCVADCVLTHGHECLAASYQSGSGTCWHQHKSKIRIKASSNEDTTFIVKTAPVTMFYRESVDFADAVYWCNFFGGRLMNLTEAWDYYDLGKSYCTCAWISDGSQVTISQPGANNTCADGVVNCVPLEPESKAWCRLNV